MPPRQEPPCRVRGGRTPPLADPAYDEQPIPIRPIGIPMARTCMPISRCIRSACACMCDRSPGNSAKSACTESRSAQQRRRNRGAQTTGELHFHTAEDWDLRVDRDGARHTNCATEGSGLHVRPIAHSPGHRARSGNQGGVDTSDYSPRRRAHK